MSYGDPCEVAQPVDADAATDGAGIQPSGYGDPCGVVQPVDADAPTGGAGIQPSGYGDPCDGLPVPVEGGHVIFIQDAPPSTQNAGDLWWDGDTWNQWNGVAWEPQENGVATFIDLLDTPLTYVDQAGKIPKVSATEDGIIFVDPEAAASVSWGGIQGELSDQGDLQDALDQKLGDAPLTNGPFGRFGGAWVEAVGPTGPQGDPGVDGADGAPGAKGDTGDTGPAGADGVDGATGPEGSPGPQGDPGADGSDGAPGADGATGPEGPSAVSTDAGNIAEIGTDSLIWVPAPDDRMAWRGQWAAGTYLANDVVRSGNWTMVANKETEEYPSPQAATDIAWAVFGDAIPTWVAQSTSTTRLLTGIKITPVNVVVVQSLRVWIPFVDPDVGYYVVSQVEGQVPQYEHIFPTETGWFLITFSAALLGAGVPVEVYLVTQGQGTLSETFTYNWDRRSPNQSPNPDSPPLLGQFEHYVKAAPDIAYINKTDDDGVSRKGDLDTLQAGDNIAWTDSGGVDVFYTLTAAPIYHNSAVSDEDFYELNLSPAVGLGSNGSVAMTFTHFLDRPTSYVQITDRFSGTANVKGLLSTTGNVDDVIETDDAYGIDVLYQEIAFPVDWEVVAFSGG